MNLSKLFLAKGLFLFALLIGASFSSYAQWVSPNSSSVYYQCNQNTRSRTVQGFNNTNLGYTGPKILSVNWSHCPSKVGSGEFVDCIIVTDGPATWTTNYYGNPNLTPSVSGNTYTFKVWVPNNGTAYFMAVANGSSYPQNRAHTTFN